MSDVVTVTLPDGKQLELTAGATILDVAAEIGPGLAKAALAGRIDGALVDLRAPIREDVALSIVTSKDESGGEVIRHSAEHVMAVVVEHVPVPAVAVSGDCALVAATAAFSASSLTVTVTFTSPPEKRLSTACVAVKDVPGSAPVNVNAASLAVSTCPVGFMMRSALVTVTVMASSYCAILMPPSSSARSDTMLTATPFAFGGVVSTCTTTESSTSLDVPSGVYTTLSV